MVVQLRYGFGTANPNGTRYSLAETARIMKVTRERVRQIGYKAVDKLNDLCPDWKVAHLNIPAGSPP